MKARHRLRQWWDTCRHAARHRDAFETTAADRDRWQALCETTAADRDRWKALCATDDDLMLGMVVFLVWQRDGTPETLIERTLEWIGDYGDGARLPRSLMEADNLKGRIPEAIIRYAGVAFRVQRSAVHLLPLVRFALDNADPASQSFLQRHAVASYFVRHGLQQGDEETLKEAAAFERDYIARAVAEGKLSRNPARAHLRGLFVQALPKSGTTFLTTTLRQSLDLHGVIAEYRGKGNYWPWDTAPFKPYLETLGLKKEGDNRIMGQHLVPDILSLGVQQGGLLLSGHAPGRRENLAVMREQGIDKAVILMRDPRQAAISMYHYRLKIGYYSMPEIPEPMDIAVKSVFLENVLWNNSWLTARDAGDIRVHIVRFEDMAADAQSVVASIYDFWGLSLDDYPPVFPEKNAATHFRAGKTDSWKTDLDEDTKAAMAKVMEKVPCGY